MHAPVKTSCFLFKTLMKPLGPRSRVFWWILLTKLHKCRSDEMFKGLKRMTFGLVNTTAAAQTVHIPLFSRIFIQLLNMQIESNRKRLSLIFFCWRMLLLKWQFCWLTLGKVWYMNSTQGQKKYKCVGMFLFSFFLNSKHHERSKRRDGRAWDSFHRFVNIGQCAPANWRSEIQVCFWCHRRILDAKFQWQTMLKKRDSPLHNCVPPSIQVFVKMFRRNLQSPVWQCHVGVHSWYTSMAAGKWCKHLELTLAI